MDWDREIEVEGGKVVLGIAEIQDLLIANLTKGEIEEFAGELIKWVEFRKPLDLVNE